MTVERDAVEALVELGLTEYEAKCFVALNRVPKAKAKEISQLSEVPRSRVYDVLDLLHKRGLVDIQQSDPREYRAVAKDEAFDKLRRDYDETIETADDALEELDAVSTIEDKGAWAIASADHVLDRVAALIDEATERIHMLVTRNDRPEDAVLDRLAAASDRGVAIVVEVSSEEAKERIRDAVPDARVVVAPELGETAAVEGKRPGQLLMADDHAVLASGLEESALPGVDEETAMWSQGRDHGFAVWMRELLADRPASADPE